MTMLNLYSGIAGSICVLKIRPWGTKIWATLYNQINPTQFASFWLILKSFLHITVCNLPVMWYVNVTNHIFCLSVLYHICMNRNMLHIYAVNFFVVEHQIGLVLTDNTGYATYTTIHCIWTMSVARVVNITVLVLLPIVLAILFEYWYKYWRYFSYTVSISISAILFPYFLPVFDTNTFIIRCTS